MTVKQPTERILTPIVSIPRFRAACALADKTQWQVALALGISPPALSSYIAGRTRPPEKFVKQIEDLLGVAPGTLAADVEGTIKLRKR